MGVQRRADRAARRRAERKAWKDFVRINRLVNERIRPMTDLEHFGTVEKWSYPDDGYGDCEDYVLLKRRMLMEAGWPREALLITVVRDQNGDGHAVLTVKTDRGEFVLDNQNEQVVLWSGVRLPLREAAIAVRSQRMGCTRRPAGRSRNRHVTLTRRISSRPGHVPTPPRPQTGFARGRLSPRSRPHLFSSQRTAWLLDFWRPFVSIENRTVREHDASRRGKCGEFVRPMFRPFDHRHSDHRPMLAIAAVVLPIAFVAALRRGASSDERERIERRRRSAVTAW